MNKARNLRYSLTALALVATSAMPASAQLQQFASFLYNAGTDLVSYNAGNINGTDIPIVFNYNEVMPPFLGTPSVGFGAINARLSFSGTRDNDAIMETAISGLQRVNLNSFTIVGAAGSVADGMNLISGSAVPSKLTGIFNGATATLSGTVSSGSTIMFTSDFLTFPTIPPATNASFTWTLNNVQPGLSLSGNNYNNFNSTVQGAFSYSPEAAVIPEPGSVAFLIASVGIGGGFMLSRLRKR